MKNITIKFPNEKFFTFEFGKPIVLLGANGSGKTRLGVEIEKLNDFSFNGKYQSKGLLVQRISAQKSLSISLDLPIHGYEASERIAYVGGNDQNATKRIYRYNNNPATHLIDDYNRILSLFFSAYNKQLEKFHELDRKASDEGKIRPELIRTYVEQVKDIWNDLLPKRELDLSGNEVHAIGNSRYHGKEMSDGERVILYMIVQVISIRKNSVIIIDEPELHIHKAILNKLWDSLERMRPDCIFIYITHNLDFAVSRNTDKVLWVKSYDGDERWEYEFIDSNDFSELPEELLYELIGTRKKVLFVEGTKSSLDYNLYREIYSNLGYHVIPCGGCQQVINYVRSKKGYNKLNSIEVKGVIDRDFRTEEEIQRLSIDGIFTLAVAEVENLFVVPELLDVITSHLGCDNQKNEEMKELIKKIYLGKRESQIKEAFAKEVDFQMSIMRFEDNEITPSDIKNLINKKFTYEFIEKVLRNKRAMFPETGDIKTILKIFNYKELYKIVGSKLGFNSNEYPKRVIRLMQNDVNGIRKRIIDAVAPYLPTLE